MVVERRSVGQGFAEGPADAFGSPLAWKWSKMARAMSAQRRFPALSVTQRLSSFSSVRTQTATGPPGVVMIPAAVLAASRLPALKAALVPGGRNRGNLSLS